MNAPRILTIKCAIYTRVSTDEQAKEGYSLDAQAERLSDTARASGWQVYEVYRDDGYSAKNRNRPALKRMMSDAFSGMFDAVLVYRIDRLSRSLKDLIEIVTELSQQKVGFKSATELIDTTTPEGRLMFHQFGSFAQYERELIGQRTKMGLMKRLKMGFWNTSPPYGYKLVKKKLIIHEPEARIVRMIFDCFLNKNMGVTIIAMRLNDQNIKRRTANKWRGTRVYKIITNPVYTGMVRWGGDEAQGVHKAIIEKDTFAETQARLRYKKKETRRFMSPNYLSGLVKCGLCGSSMSVTYPGKKDWFKYYVCGKRATTKECKQDYIRVDILDKSVINEIMKLSNKPKIINSLITDYLEHSRNKIKLLQEKEKAIKEVLVHSQKGKDRLANVIISKNPDKSMVRILNEKSSKLMQEEDEHKKELWHIEGKIKNLQSRNYGVKGISDFLKNFAMAFEGMEPGEKKLMIESLIEEVKIGRNKEISFVFTPPYNSIGFGNPVCVPTGNRTPVRGLKSPCPRPLDDGDVTI